MDTIYALPKNRSFPCVFRKGKEFLNLKDYQIIKGSEEWKRVPVEKFPGFLKGCGSKIKGKRNRIFYCKTNMQ